MEKLKTKEDLLKIDKRYAEYFTDGNVVHKLLKNGLDEGWKLIVTPIDDFYSLYLLRLNEYKAALAFNDPTLNAEQNKKAKEVQIKSCPFFIEVLHGVGLVEEKEAKKEIKKEVPVKDNQEEQKA